MNNKNLIVADDMVVRLDYTLTLADGEEFDSSTDTGPLEYLHGQGQIVAGLEEALYGMGVGDEKAVVVTPDFAYGEYDPEAVQMLPRDVFPPDMPLEPGMTIDLYDEETDEEIEATIAEVQRDNVMIDFNHPLAGETLHFQVKVLALRPALPEEIEHGHVHGADDED